MRGSIKQCPRDRDPLPFAAGQRLPALADQRIVAVRQPQDELVSPRRPGRGDDFIAVGVRPAVGDVLGDRAVEQERLLQHDADVAAILLDRERANIGAVDQDGAGGDIVEAADRG